MGIWRENICMLIDQLPSKLAFADKVGVAEQSVRRWVNGSVPKLPAAMRVACRLGYRIDDMILRNLPPNPTTTPDPRAVCGVSWWDRSVRAALPGMDDRERAAEIARISSIRETTARAWLFAGRDPHLDAAVEVARALGIDLHDAALGTLNLPSPGAVRVSRRC